MFNIKKSVLGTLTIIIFLFVAVIYAPVPVQAETITSQAPVLIVGATGTVTAVPDQAKISLAVTNIDQNLSNAQYMNNQTTQAVLSALLKSGVDKKDIQTLNYSISPQYDYSTERDANTPPKIIGYRVSNEISAVVKNIDSVGNVLDTAVKAGANDINYISFEKSDISFQENEALAKAVARGRSKAEIIASAAGMELGNIVEITEGGINTILPNRDIYINAGNSKSAYDESAQVPVNPGDISVSATIYITYELK